MSVMWTFMKAAAYKLKKRFKKIFLGRGDSNMEKVFENKREYKKGLTSIIILTYDQLHYTKLCLESIRKYTEEDTYEIIIVDNHSTDGTVQWLKEQKNIKLILNDENLGFPKGCNQGIEIASGDSVLLLNNDTIVSKNWLVNLRKALFSDEYVGAVGPVTNNCDNNQRIEVPYKNIEEMYSFAQEYNISNTEKWHETIMLIGFCLLIKSEVIEQIGLLDERFTPGNYEDNDYCFRIKKAGYSLILCRDTFVHHYANVSFNKDPNLFAEVLITNREKFKEKWKFIPFYYHHIRKHLLALVKEPKEKELKVLDVGCGLGNTLLEFKNRYKNTSIYGIELNRAVGEIAQTHGDVIIGNIEEINLDFDEGYFDYMILGDILEHLVEPYETIMKLKRHLKKDGYMLISIPNVMHNSVIKSLLHGNWTYEDAGILDRTHLRFFTYREIIKMFEETGLNVIDCITIRAEGDREFVNKLVSITAPYFEWEYYTVQFLFKVKLKDQVNDV